MPDVFVSPDEQIKKPEFPIMPDEVPSTESQKSVIENQGIEYIETSDKIEFDCTSITNAYEFGVLIGKFRRENEIMDRLLFTDTFVKKIKNEHVPIEDREKINKAVAPLFFGDPFKKNLDNLHDFVLKQY